MSKFVKILILLLVVLGACIFIVNRIVETRTSSVANVNKQRTFQLPAGFPRYSETQLLETNLNNAQKPIFTWQTSDKVEKVMAWYQENLKKDGWNITIPPSTQNAYMNIVANLEARKGSLILQLSVIREGQATKIIAEFPDPSMFEEQEELQ